MLNGNDPNTSNDAVRAETYRIRALALRKQCEGLRYELKIKLEVAEFNLELERSKHNQPTATGG